MVQSHPRLFTKYWLRVDFLPSQGARMQISTPAWWLNARSELFLLLLVLFFVVHCGFPLAVVSFTDSSGLLLHILEVPWTFLYIWATYISMLTKIIEENSVAHHYLGCKNPTAPLTYIQCRRGVWRWCLAPCFAAYSATFYSNWIAKRFLSTFSLNVYSVFLARTSALNF